MNRALLARLDSSRGARKAALLRVLSERKAPEAEKKIVEALGDPDIDVKVTALDLAGKLDDAASQAVLESALEKGLADTRELASRAYLDHADRRLAQDSKAAGKMYAQVLEVSSDPALKGRAVLGMAMTGESEYLPRIEAARKQAGLERSANQAYVAFAKALGKGGKRDEAVAMLLSVVSSGAGRETVQSAVVSLKELGADPTVFQKRLGFLASWWLMGPFPNNGGKGFDVVYPPEMEVRLDGTQKDEKGRARKWQEFHATNLEGLVDLRQAFQRSSDVCAYAYSELEVAEAQDVRFKMGSDDGIICWLNGKKIHSNNVTRPCQVDQDVVEAHLEAGKNKILVKITQGGGEWEFCLRMTDQKDKPLDLTVLGKKEK